MGNSKNLINSKLYSMKQLFFVILTIALQFSLFCTQAQQSDLWLRNGKKITISNYSVDELDYYDGKIYYTTIKGKVKSKYMEDVFSVVEKDGEEKIFYKQNMELGEILTPIQMKSYILGLNEMRNTKISPWVGIGGFASGFITAVTPQPEINFGDNSVPLPLGVFIPITYVAIMGATPPNADKLKLRIPDKANDEHYLLGYQDGIRKKRIKHSLIGAVIGVAAGFVTVAIVN